MCKEKVKTIVKKVIDCLKKHKSIITALCILMLCYGISDKVVAIIDSTLLHLTDFGRSVWLDWVFICITISLAVIVYAKWIKAKKVVAARTVGILLIPLGLYAYFRFYDNTHYNFTGYWDGPFTYLDGLALVGVSIIILFVCQKFKKVEPENQKGIHFFEPDAPIDNAADDMFQMESLVSRIVNFITFTDVKNSAFSMGIVGDWGDGKSSLMNLVEEKLRSEHNDFLIVHFNPRSSKKAAFIQEDFLDSLKQSLAPKHSGIDYTIDRYAVALDAIPGMPKIFSKLLDLLQIDQDKNKKVKRDDLQNAILEINRRIIVFIDDLDRLTGEELIEVMKVLDTNGAFPNMVFITGYDKDYVNEVLIQHLKLSNQTRPYTDKYFTVEVRVPLHPSFRLMNYLVELLTKACKTGYIANQSMVVENMTRQLFAPMMPRLRTIRDIKRFANQFLYDYAEVQKDVNFQDFLLLELIKFAHPKDYEDIYRLKIIHRGNSNFLYTASDELYYLNEELLPQKDETNNRTLEPKIKVDSIDILNRLFPSEDNYQLWYGGRYQRIYSASSFEHYFYNYEFSHLKSDDIDQIFKKESLAEVCKLIDGWGGFAKDLETYLLTRDIFTIKDKRILRRFMQALLYSSYRFKSINYIGQNYSFLRKDDVNRIIENCGFSSVDDYVKWLKESLEELMPFNPNIPSHYIRSAISGLFDQNATQDLYILTLEELQDYALELLNKYLKKIDEETWNAEIAVLMWNIQNDADGDVLPEAIDAMHDAVANHFERFSAIMPVVFDEQDLCHAGYSLFFRFSKLFKDKDELENLICSEKNNNAPEIALIRSIWPIYKANGYSNFALPKGGKAEEAKKTMLKSALEDLSRYEELNKKTAELENEWNKGRRLLKVDEFKTRAAELLKELKTIALSIKLQETCENSIQKLMSDFKQYEETARNLNFDLLRNGDIVKMKDIYFEKYKSEYPDRIYFSENLFTVVSKFDKQQLQLGEFHRHVPLSVLEAVLIDGKEDAVVYYDPVIAASVVAKGKPVPAHHTDYSYFMDHFKKCQYDDELTYFDKVNEQNLQFVHEVQHWLKDEFHDDGLKVHH